MHDTSLLRHITACRNTTLPGERLVFSLGERRIGFVTPDFAARLLSHHGVSRHGEGIRCTDPAALTELVRALGADGTLLLRNEAFDVFADDAPDTAAPVAQIDRGALPRFGIVAKGAHLNGRVWKSDGLHLWIAHRSLKKLNDPGKLDHIVAGGVPAGLSPDATLIKEAGEEASLPPALAAKAKRVGRIAYAMERAEGLRRDQLYCYDIDLPEDFIPRPGDDEVSAFTLWPIRRVLATLRETDAFKFNVTLVLIDLFLREGLIEGEEATMLRAALDWRSSPA